MTRTPRGRCTVAAGPIAAMRGSSTTTVTSRRGGAPVMSITVACVTARSCRTSALLAVRHPDVLHVRRGAQELAAFAIVLRRPIAVVPASPRPLHVRRRRQLHHLHAALRTEVPHRLHVVVLG